MRDVLGPGTILGYCTNVHLSAEAYGPTGRAIDYALKVKQAVSSNERMGIGWWLAAGGVHAISSAVGAHAPIRTTLRTDALEPFTFNGFPYGDFHQGSVKHAVYEPNWSMLSRAAYTKALAYLHARLSDSPCERSISTLPIGWSEQTDAVESIRLAAERLLEVVGVLARLDEGGWLIHVDLEPEPGCLLQRSADLPAFFDGPLADAGAGHLPTEMARHHLRVCHDICHAAVMFEDQAQVLQRYRSAGIKVGKVQISNAIRVPFDEYSESERREALQQLRGFAEDRYLHQTMIRMSDGEMRFFEDLPLALASVTDGQTARGEWRVHFHVPVFLERFGLIQTTQRDIGECLAAIEPDDRTNHYEVETYAWDVLPPELRTDDLADGIARELMWVKEVARGLKR